MAGSGRRLRSQVAQARDRHPAEIGHLLAKIPDEHRLSKQLDAWGFNYTPQQGTTLWLLDVRDRIINGLQPSEPRPTPGTTPEHRDSEASAASTEPRDPLEIEYPALWHFLGAYLHQDWQHEYTSPLFALEDLIAHEKGAGFELAKEIDRLLAVSTNDVELETLLFDLGFVLQAISAWRRPASVVASDAS